MIENIKDIKDKFDNFKPYINGYQNMKRASVLVPILKITIHTKYYLK